MEISVYDEDLDEGGQLEQFLPYIEKKGKYGENILTLYIDIKTGIIKDWIDKTGGIPANYFEKVVDTGKYTLLDVKGRILKCLEGYVPNKLIPDKDGYGDYITLDVNSKGKITNWYSNPSFEEFIDEDEDDDS
jgi:hypothetical protein